MQSFVGNYPYLGVLHWFSWTHFAYVEFDSLQRWASLSNVLAEKMDHGSSVFGLPSNPPEYEDFPDWMTPRTSMKSRIATRVIDTCLEKVKVEAMLRIERTLKEEGLEGFRLILNGNSVIDELAKVSMSHIIPQKDE